MALGAVDASQALNASHGQDVVTENPVGWTPHAMNGAVISMVQVGDRMIAAGSFTSVSPAGTIGDTSDDLKRNRIFAFDATSGEIDRSFNPNIKGVVNSIDTDGTSIYVAGRFGSVGGNKKFKRIVKLTPSGDIDKAFRAVPNRKVNEVVVRGNRAYIGGNFSTIRQRGTKSQRSRLAALDTDTGALLSSVNLTFSGTYDPDHPAGTAVRRFDLNASGSKLVAIGNFTRVGGQSRRSVVVLNTGGPTATVAPWDTDRYGIEKTNCANVFNNPMRDLDISPDGSFFVISTTGAFSGGANRGSLCDTTSRWEMASTGNDPSWIGYTGGDTTYGVAITGGVVYVGGHFRWQNNPFQGDQAGPGAVKRKGVAALDAVNGLPLSWDPRRARGVGAQAMYATDQGLWVGSDTKWFGGKKRGRIAFVPLAGGSTLPSVAEASLPNDAFMAGGSSGGAALARRPLGANGAPTGGASQVSSNGWSEVRGAFYINGDLYYGQSDGTLRHEDLQSVEREPGVRPERRPPQRP